MPSTTPAEARLEGGCACGAVRFRIDVQPTSVGYCHCRMCQKAAGAPVMVFGSVPLTNFELIAGEPAKRRSSDSAERWFCRDCGTALAMMMIAEPETVEISVPTLDMPEAAAPGFHIWTESRIPWFDVADDLPRHERAR